MTIVIADVQHGDAKAKLCTEIICELPRSFGRPEANADYVRDMADCTVFGASVARQVQGLMALQVQFASTCNIWWLGVRPSAHRRGIGRALMARSVEFARTGNCSRMAWRP